VIERLPEHVTAALLAHHKVAGVEQLRHGWTGTARRRGVGIGRPRGVAARAIEKAKAPGAADHQYTRGVVEGAVAVGHPTDGIRGRGEPDAKVSLGWNAGRGEEAQGEGAAG